MLKHSVIRREKVTPVDDLRMREITFTVWTLVLGPLVSLLEIELEDDVAALGGSSDRIDGARRTCEHVA